VVRGVRLLAGVKVMMVPVMSWEYVPVTSPPGPVTAKVVVLTEVAVAFMAVLKVALMAALRHTPVAPLAGVVESNMGGALTVAAAVVKFQT
jgi:hypothetical protein